MRAMFMAGLAVAVGLAFGGAALAEGHEGPHKGAIVEWGEEEYHLELVTDAKEGTVTVYVYGGEDDLKKGTAKPIDSKSLTLGLKGTPATTVKLEPAAQKGDPKGSASVFTAKGEAFKKGAKLEGTLSGKVGTKPYSGEFKQK